MLKEVIFSGHLYWPYDEATNKPAEKGKIKETDNGNKYTIFRLRMLRNQTDAEGKPLKMFVRCIAWNDVAEKIIEYPNGTPVEVVGQFDMDEFTSSDGTKRQVVTIIARRVGQPPKQWDEGAVNGNGKKYVPPGEPKSKAKIKANDLPDDLPGEEIVFDDDVPF